MIKTLPVNIPLPSMAGSLEGYIQAVNRFPLLTEEDEVRYALQYRGSATVEQHRALRDCALKRDTEGAKSILTDHINSCVAHALSIGTLK